MKAEFNYSDNVTFVFDLSKYKDEVAIISAKYLNKNLSSATDENEVGGFWDLADKLITENIP